jgi:UDP-N-acetylglucosamine pyrophosphorylase
LFLEIICLRFSFVDHKFDKRQKGNLTGGLLIYSSNRLKVTSTSKIRNEKRKENENEMNGQKNIETHHADDGSSLSNHLQERTGSFYFCSKI